MKKLLIIKCFALLFYMHSYAQRADAFDNMRDSLLISMKHQILDDLFEDNIQISDRSWWNVGLGESFIFEVVFYDKKTSYILIMHNTTGSVNKVFSEQIKRSKLKKNIMMKSFRKSVNENHALPYDLLDHFEYRFLILFTPEEKSKNRYLLNKLADKDALYGEYKFKAQKEGLTILEKHIEILQGEDAVKQKYNMCF